MLRAFWKKIGSKNACSKSEHAEIAEGVGRGGALFERLFDPILGAGLRQRQGEHLLLRLTGYTQDTVGIAYENVARGDFEMPHLDRYPIGGDDAAASLIERVTPVAEYVEAECQDGFGVAHIAIADDAGCA